MSDHDYSVFKFSEFKFTSMFAYSSKSRKIHLTIENPSDRYPSFIIFILIYYNISTCYQVINYLLGFLKLWFGCFAMWYRVIILFIKISKIYL